MPSYSLLSWCPRSTVPFGREVLSGQECKDSNEIRICFADDVHGYFIVKDCLKYFSFCARTDGVFLLYFTIDEQANSNEENSEEVALRIAEFLNSYVKFYMGHRHFFHPAEYPKSKSKNGFLHLSAIELHDLSSFDLSPAFLELSELERALVGSLNDERDIYARLFRILSNDSLVCRLTAKYLSIYNKPKRTPVSNLPRCALLAYRAQFAKVFDKIFEIKHTAESYANSIWFSIPFFACIYLSFYLPYWRRVIEVSEAKLATIMGPVGYGSLRFFGAYFFLFALFGASQRISAIFGQQISINLRFGTPRKLDSDYLADSIQKKIRSVARSRSFLQVAILFAIIFTFENSRLYLPINELDTWTGHQLPIPTFSFYLSSVLRTPFYFLVPLFSSVILLWYMETNLKHRAWLRHIDATIGTLHFGNVFSSCLGSMSMENNARNFRFDDAIDILKIVRKQSKKQLSRKQYFFSILFFSLIICLLASSWVLFSQ